MGGLLCDRAVLDAGGDNEQLSGSQRYRLGLPQLDAESPIPTQEQLVFLVVMPGKLTFEPNDAHNSVVGDNHIGRLPRSLQCGDSIAYRYRSIFHEASVATRCTGVLNERGCAKNGVAP